MKGLWKETMQFLIDLLESSEPEMEDLVLRHALHPLAAHAQEWGNLIHRLIQGTLDLNSTHPIEEARRESSLWVLIRFIKSPNPFGRRHEVIDPSCRPPRISVLF